MDRILEYEIPSEYDGANITTVLKQHFKISTNLIKDLKKYKEGIQVNGEHKRVVDLVAKGDILKITIRDTAPKILCLPIFRLILCMKTRTCLL